MKKMVTLFVTLLVLVLLVGCNLPVNPTPTQPVLPTAKVTAQPPSATVPVVVITATLPPMWTATSAPPTATEVPPTATEPPPTATQVPPTATRTLPPPTATKPPVRPGTIVNAIYYATPPVIDGDWNDHPGKEYAAEVVVFGRANWIDRDDLVGSFRLGWDKTYLYLAVKVRDDEYVQNASGELLFKGDSLEVILDTDLLGDFYTNVLSPDDYQLGISPGKPTVNISPQAYRWLPASKKGLVTGVKIKSIRDNSTGITRIEVAIPWTVFNITPELYDRFGFALSVSDNDDPLQNIQQSMVSSAKGRVLTNPTTWGELILVK